MGKLHYLTVLLLIILLALVSGWVFQSIEKDPTRKKETLRHAPDYFLKNFTSTSMNEKGKPTYKVKASHLEHYPDDNSLIFQMPLFSFYEKNIITWTVQANQATAFENSEIIHLKGDVILNQITSKTNIPIHLNAEQMTLEPKKNLAYTKSNIKLRKGSNHIQAKGMRADMQKNKIEFLSNTRSHYIVPAK